MIPKARANGLLFEQVEDELLVYDRERDRGHRLNRTAAAIWRHCDGHRTVDDLVATLRGELDPAVDENLVLITLDRLSAEHLLEEPLGMTVDRVRASRRQFVRKVGLVGALSLLLPVITTITAPTYAQAQSGPPCESCTCPCLPPEGGTAPTNTPPAQTQQRRE
jgi:hypothetical protein